MIRTICSFEVVSKAPFVDNTFTGWRGAARIEQPELGLAITLEASPECRFFHVFIPPGQDYFCAEPTSAMPNAWAATASRAPFISAME